MQAASSSPPPTDKAVLRRRIERLDAPADLKVLLEKLLDATMEVGGRLVSIGSRVLDFVMEFSRAYPSVALGVAAALVISFLVHAIPVLGPLLSPILTPLLLIVGIGLGTLNDMMDVSMKVRMAGFEAQLRSSTVR